MPDINVLVYAHREHLHQHAAAAAWLADLATGAQAFALSELVIGGFVRVVTNPRIFSSPSTIDEALTFLDELIARPTCRLVRPGPRHLGIFTSLCRDHRATGGLVADAYHAALAIEHGCTWVSYDTDFARFKALEWRTP
jgi:toxin-antitoxin system PIN domain toxin